jgi:hypothetical protein
MRFQDIQSKPVFPLDIFGNIKHVFRNVLRTAKQRGRRWL